MIKSLSESTGRFRAGRFQIAPAALMFAKCFILPVLNCLESKPWIRVKYLKPIIFILPDKSSIGDSTQSYGDLYNTQVYRQQPLVKYRKPIITILLVLMDI